MSDDREFGDFEFDLDGLRQLHASRHAAPGASAGSMTLTERYERELAFRDAIQDAKRRLSQQLLSSRARSDTFAWTADGPKLRVVVGRGSVGGVHPVRRRALHRLTAASNAQSPVVVERRPSDPNAAMHLVVEGECDRDGHVSDPRIVLELGPAFFTARPAGAVAARGQRDPSVVVDLLGRAMPRMLAREARRQRLSPPQWIVTGRAALWPPLFEAITTTATKFGGRAPPLPFDPAEMKAAVLRGAMALAIDGRLSLGDDVPRPLAMVDEVTDVANPEAKSVQKLSAIRYVEGSESPSGSAGVLWYEASRLVQIVPGLADDPATGEPDRDAIDLLRLFGVPYQRELAQRVTATGEVPITWSWNGGQPDVRIGPDAVQRAPGRSA